MKAFPLLPLAVAIGIASQSAVAAEVNPLIVTATRIAQTADETLVPVSVVTREEIERSSAKSLADLLVNLPGVDFSVSGGYGKTSSLYLRGTGSGHTLVLIDGVRAGSATLGSFSFEQIPLSQIERIEVVRGPRSSLYGSEAIGGVIQIFTRSTAEESISARVAAGSEETRIVESNVSFGNDKTRVGLSLGYFETDGIDARVGDNPDRDGYRNNSFTFKIDQKLGEQTKVQLSLLQASSENHYDDVWAPVADNYSTGLQQTLSLRASHSVNEQITFSGGLGQYRDESETFDSWPAEINTRRVGADLKVDLSLSDDQIITLGGDYYNENVSNSTSAYSKDKRNNKAVFGQLQQQFGSASLLIGLRRDHSNAYGRKDTGNINFGYELAAGHRLLASYGTAFKAPTFNDLYWPDSGFSSGNPDLKPEEAQNVELGYEGRSKVSSHAVRFFRNTIDNLINWAPDGSGKWMPMNVANASIYGLEIELTGKIEDINLSAQLTLLDTEDNSTGQPLENRVEKSLSLGVGRDMGRFSWHLNAVGQGERDTLPGYALLDFMVDFQLNERLSLSAELANLLDKEYRTNAGYNSPGHSWLVSLNYRK